MAVKTADEIEAELRSAAAGSVNDSAVQRKIAEYIAELSEEVDQHARLLNAQLGAAPISALAALEKRVADLESRLVDRALEGELG